MRHNLRMSKAVEDDQVIHTDVSPLDSGAAGVTACGVEFTTRYRKAEGRRWERGVGYLATHKAKPCPGCEAGVRVAEACVLLGAAIQRFSVLGPSAV
jgi:hypothetical protein